ncbi:MAG: PAS domain-containing protein [Microcoleus sp.]
MLSFPYVMPMSQLDRTVLIIDDSSVERETYRRYLLQETDFAYTLWEAESAASALRLCDRQLPDGIILDYLLPDMNGLEFLVELQHRFSRCPSVVMLTDYEDATVAVRAIKTGAEDYLAKQNLTPAELRLAVKSAIANVELRQKIQQYEKQFRTSVENMLDCFGIFSAIRDETGQIIDFRFDYLNAAALESNCMTVTDLGKRLCEVFPAHHRSGLFAEYCQVVETGQPLIKESLDYSDTFGDRFLTRAYDIRASKLNDGFVASWRNITDRKRSEVELQTYQTQLQLAMQSAKMGFWDLNLITKNAVWSPEAKQLLGWPIDWQQCDYTTLQRRIHPDDRELFELTISESIESGNHQIEFRVVWDDGSIHWLANKGQIFYDETHRALHLVGMSTDISDCKQAEEIILQNEQRLQLAVKTAKLGYWQLDLTTYELYSSDRCKANFGLPPTVDLTYQRLFELIHPDDRDRVRELISSAIENHRDYEAEYRNIWPDGSIHWLVARGNCSYDRDGTPLRMSGVTTDISDRKQIECALQQSEEVARQQLNEIEAIYANAPIGLCFIDTDLRFVRINEHLAEINGLPASAHIGRTLHEILPEMAEDLEPLYRQVIESGNPLLNLEVRGSNRARPGVERDWIFSLHPLENSDGTVLGVNAMVQEITDRKQAESNLRDSEERFQQLANCVPHLFWILEPMQQRLIYASPAYEKIWGRPLAEVYADYRQWMDAIHSDDRDRVAAHFAQTMMRGDYNIEYRIVRPDGSIRWICDRGFPIHERSGEVHRVAGIAEDITQRKQWEQERERLLAQAQAAREAAEAANRSKDEFIAMVAHELRSPLNSVMGWAKMLQSRSFDRATTTKALETIVRNTQAQVQLIDDLLDISRMICGKLNLTLQPVNLASAIEAALEMVRPMAAAKQILLATQIQPVGQISGDLNRLQQIAINLLTNAIKFTPVGGRVEVRLEEIDTQACLQVCDTGKGIAPDFLPYIFERFQQAQTSGGAKDGLGLGLAIVKHLVELHGGAIAAASPGVGQGSTFTVMLPLLEATGGRRKDDDRSDLSLNPSSLPLAGIRILAVDDEPDSLEMLRFTLEVFGGTVASATTAAAVLELLPQFQPDILLCDIAMPDMNGYDLLCQIRQLEIGQMPAIAVTAYASLVDREKSLQAGFQHHFSKPVEPESLVAEIVKISRRNS